MIQDYKDIGGYWGVVFCYGYDERDYEEIEEILYTFGLDTDNARRSIDILSDPNTGMTVSLPKLKMSVVFISRATSREQWVDTIMHEADHLQASILDYYGIRQGSEEAAYLQGYIARKTTSIIDNICPMCGKTHNYLVD